MSKRLCILSLTALLAAAVPTPRAAEAQISAPAAAATVPVADAELEARREQLRQKLVSFVIIDYLGTGVSDHQNMPELYADSVDYYGRERSRGAVMAEKRAYYRKWPMRRYDFIESSLVPKAGSREGVEFSFRYTFEVSDRRRKATGTGTATLEVLLLDDDRVVIVKEDGRVLNQSSRPL